MYIINSTFLIRNHNFITRLQVNVLNLQMIILQRTRLNKNLYFVFLSVRVFFLHRIYTFTDMKPNVSCYDRVIRGRPITLCCPVKVGISSNEWYSTVCSTVTLFFISSFVFTPSLYFFGNKLMFWSDSWGMTLL